MQKINPDILKKKILDLNEEYKAAIAGYKPVFGDDHSLYLMKKIATVSKMKKEIKLRFSAAQAERLIREMECVIHAI